jgi:hypothetical protein
MEKTENETMNREVLKTQMYEISSEKITFFGKECFEAIQDDWTLADGSTVSERFDEGYEKIVLYKNGGLTLEPPKVSALLAIDDQGEQYDNAAWSKILDYLNNLNVPSQEVEKRIKELQLEADRQLLAILNGIAANESLSELKISELQMNILKGFKRDPEEGHYDLRIILGDNTIIRSGCDLTWSFVKEPDMESD